MSYSLDDVELVHARKMREHPFQPTWKGYNHYSFLLALEGDLYHQMDDGERVQLEPPFIFWNHPDHVYHYGPREGKWTHAYAAFTGERAKWIMEEGLMALQSESYILLDDASYFEACFDRIVKSFVDNEEHASQEGILLIESMFLELKKTSKRPATRRYNPKEKDVLRIADIIKEDPLRKYDFHEWAADNGMSYSNFRLLFRKVLKTSPQQHLLKHRFHWARKKVTDTDMPFQQIGFEIGYQNPSVFSRAFKQFYGISAQEVRRSFNAD